MTDKQYTELVYRTLSLKDDDNIGHSIIGLSTEAGELLDAYKKHKFYGRELDVQNLKEEIGDLFWYLAVLCNEIGYSFDKAKIDNICKLEKRYPEGFKDVVSRNVDKELNHIDKGM